MLTLFVLAFALAADAFAVSIARGAASSHLWKNAILTGIVFGLMHVVMIALGWFVGDIIDAWKDVAPWIACAVLCLLGGKLLTEGLEHDEESSPTVGQEGAGWALTGLLSASLATSLDGAAAGITLPLLGLSFLTNAIVIGSITAILCVIGFRAGSHMGSRWGNYAEIGGGVLLILVGINLLA